MARQPRAAVAAAWPVRRIRNADARASVCLALLRRPVHRVYAGSFHHVFIAVTADAMRRTPRFDTVGSGGACTPPSGLRTIGDRQRSDLHGRTRSGRAAGWQCGVAGRGERTRPMRHRVRRARAAARSRHRLRGYGDGRTAANVAAPRPIGGDVHWRTLQEWEQGRRAPSGAARTLLMIAAKNPRALVDVA